jgi:hypothetical protein
MLAYKGNLLIGLTHTVRDTRYMTQDKPLTKR